MHTSLRVYRLLAGSVHGRLFRARQLSTAHHHANPATVSSKANASTANPAFRPLPHASAHFVRPPTASFAAANAARDTLASMAAAPWNLFTGMFSWYWPTSDAQLEKAEKAVLDAYVKSPHKVYQVPIGNGASINTISFGAHAENPENVTMVMTHGFGSGMAFWYRNFDAFARAPYVNLHAVDWLGMGRSSRPPFSAQTPEEAEAFFVDSLEQWRQEMKIDRFVLLGHSLGGFLSAAYALKHPERVIRLILVSPVGIPKRPDESPADAAPAQARAEPWFLKAVRTAWGYNITPQSIVRTAGRLGPDLVKRIVRGRFSTMTDGEAQLLGEYAYHISAARASGELAFNTILSFGAFARRPLCDRLHELKVPATFIYGSRDWMDHRAAEAAQRSMTVESKVVRIPDGGHHMYIDNPIDFERSVLLELAKERARADRQRRDSDSRTGGR